MLVLCFENPYKTSGFEAVHNGHRISDELKLAADYMSGRSGTLHLRLIHEDDVAWPIGSLPGVDSDVTVLG